MVDITNTDGEGVVDYIWTKQTEDGLTSDQPKISFVKRFEEWGWIVGTGVYIDDLVAIKRDIVNQIAIGSVQFVIVI